MKKAFRLFSILFLVVAAAACDSSVYNKMKEIPDSKWSMDYPIKFDVEISDTTTLFDFFVLLRHNTDYAYNNVYFFITSTTPSDSITCDTVEFILADPDGNWIGNGSGYLKSHEILISRKFRFPSEGLYSFEFQQAMRDTVLDGISDIGIKIKPTPL